MKVPVSAYGQNLDAHINPRFGRYDFILVVDTDTMSFGSVTQDNRRRV